MAEIGGVSLFPLSFSGAFNMGSPTNYVIDAADEYAAFVFTTPTTGPTITKVAIRLGALTGNSPTYVVSLQGVTSVLPDGTIKSGSGSNDVFVEITPTSGQAGTVQEYTLGGDGYNSAAGELLCIVIAPKSGTTIDASNNWSFTTRCTGASGLPYSIESGTASRTGGPFGYSDGTTWWGFCLQQGSGYTSLSATVFAGNYFTLPAAMGDTATCVGAWYYWPLSAGTPKMSLYDADNNLLADAQFASTFTNYAYAYWDSAAVALTCGASYRLVASGVNARLNYVDVAAAVHWGTYAWTAATAYTQGNTTNGWTDTTTRRAVCGPIISDITEPTASGGMTGQHTILGLGR